MADEDRSCLRKQGFSLKFLFPHKFNSGKYSSTPGYFYMVHGTIGYIFSLSLTLTALYMAILLIGLHFLVYPAVSHLAKIQVLAYVASQVMPSSRQVVIGNQLNCNSQKNDIVIDNRKYFRVFSFGVRATQGCKELLAWNVHSEKFSFPTNRCLDFFHQPKLFHLRILFTHKISKSS